MNNNGDSINMTLAAAFTPNSNATIMNSRTTVKIPAAQQVVAQVEYHDSFNVTNGRPGTSILISQQQSVKNSLNDDANCTSQNDGIMISTNGNTNQPAMARVELRDRRPVGTTINYPVPASNNNNSPSDNTSDGDNGHSRAMSNRHGSDYPSLDHFDNVMLRKPEDNHASSKLTQEPSIDLNNTRPSEPPGACNPLIAQDGLSQTNSTNMNLGEDVSAFDGSEKSLLNRTINNGLASDPSGVGGGPQQILCKVCGDKAR